MTMRHDEDDLRIRPGRIGNDGQGVVRPKSFVGQVMRAAKKAGHAGRGFGRSVQRSGSQFGRGRSAALALSVRSPLRRVVIKARIVRHDINRLQSSTLAKHVSYLRRDGVTRDGTDARMFDARSEATDERAFAERCRGDRHHFRFIVSPEDATDMQDLREFTRELMADTEHDLGTKLDWVAVDHWNTDNPHVHVLMRGRADDGRDLVISRSYISQGIRARAEERVTLELGPRSEREVQSVLEKEVEAEYWTNLDRALRNAVDEGAGIANLRPGCPSSDPELRRLMVGRVAKLERLGLAEQVAPGHWTLKPGIQDTLCDLSIRGDIIKTMHRAMTSARRDPDVSSFALHGDHTFEPVLGRLVARGLHNELNGSAFVIVDGIDGKTHHIRFPDLELTGDAQLGAIVEARTNDGANGRVRIALAIRTDFTLQQQIAAPGATWIDRQLLARGSVIMAGGFGSEVRDAMDRRVGYLAGQGLARRQGRRIIFARNLLDTLRRRELSEAGGKLSAENGLTYRASSAGEPIAGVYRQRVTLSSGRFAMIDDGVGFQLVPWRPTLEQHLGHQVSGVVASGDVINWDFGRRRGLGL
jgi:type IV secretory pathway VirD2 relaxase